MNKETVNFHGVEERDVIEQTIVFNKIKILAEQIKNIAQQCSEISKKLEGTDISNDEREKLSKELNELVKKGVKLSEEKMRLFAQYQ